jgi:hypothetical protein
METRFTHLVKINPRKHIRACKDDIGYRFYIYYLIDIEDLEMYMNDRSFLLYSRNSIAIVFKDFYLSKETIDVMFQYSEEIK